MCLCGLCNYSGLVEISEDKCSFLSCRGHRSRMALGCVTIGGFLACLTSHGFLKQTLHSRQRILRLVSEFLDKCEVSFVIDLVAFAFVGNASLKALPNERCWFLRPKQPSPSFTVCGRTDRERIRLPRIKIQNADKSGVEWSPQASCRRAIGQYRLRSIR